MSNRIPEKPHTMEPVHIKSFSGINNVDNPWELQLDELVACVNYDIDNEKCLIMRPGRVKVSDFPLRHAYNFRGVIYGQIDQRLVRTVDFLNYETVVNDVGHGRLIFEEAEDLLVWSTDTIIQFIYKGVSYPFPVPTDLLQVQIFPGRYLCYYMGCLYIAVGDTVWQTHPLASDFAINKNPELEGCSRVFASDITLMLKVGDGIWFSDEQTLWWCPGGDLTEMKRIEFDNDNPAIPDAFCRIRPSVTETPQPGIGYYIGMKRGIFQIGNGGVYQSLTEKRYVMPAATAGKMFFTKRNGLNQVITLLDQ